MLETLRARCKTASIMRSHRDACALEHWPYHDAKTQSSNFFEPSLCQLVTEYPYWYTLPGHCCRVCSLPSGPARCSRPTLFVFHLHVVLLPARGCVAYAAAEIPCGTGNLSGEKEAKRTGKFPSSLERRIVAKAPPPGRGRACSFTLRRQQERKKFVARFVAKFARATSCNK